MSEQKYILAIDQGTTSTKAIVLSQNGEVVSTSASQRFEIEARYPQPGWVEYDPDQIWKSVRDSAHVALNSAGLGWHQIAGLGLANQGETVVAFDAASGKAIYPAISWQDRRGEDLAASWRSAGWEDRVIALTGLRLDPYFSAAKLAWILRHVSEADQLQTAGRLRLGTTDAWILWQLSGGDCFVTDVSTASRTMLFDLHTLNWSEELASTFGIPLSALPQISSNASKVGTTSVDAFGSDVPITGLCVDQQAALFGQLALEVGQAKVTYGTGCFLLANIGSDSSRRADGLLTSVGWRIGDETSYVFDGGVYSAGSLIDWLVELGLAVDIAEVEALAAAIDGPSPVSLIPAFSGLASPHWSGHARACWMGMDQSTQRQQLVRAALDAIAFRVQEIFDAMRAAGVELEVVNVDGGLTQSETLMQLQADLLRVPLLRRDFTEATALGVAYLAGLGIDMWRTPRDIPQNTTPARSFAPCEQIRVDYRNAFARWKRICSYVIEMGDAGLFRSDA